MNMDLELPGGVITTHCVSTVIRPGSKVTHDPLQFVKIQSTELSKKAVEQIRLAEEVKITKDKIKEVEEEWQNNLLNWKSKRRQSRTTTNCSLTDTEGDHDNEDDDHHHHHLSHHHHHLSHHLSHHHLSHHHHDDINNRKIKTFSEILNEKAKSGYRIGYNLHKYIRNGSEDDDEEEEEDEDEGCKMMEDDVTSRLSSSSDDSSEKKIIINQSSSSQSSESSETTPAPTSTTNDSYSGSSKTVNGDNEDDQVDDDGDDGDDEAAHDSVDDRSSSSSLSSSSKLVNGQPDNSNGLKKSPLDNDNELIDRKQQQQSNDGHQQLTGQRDHQQINLEKNSHNLDYHKSGNNQHGIKKLTLTPSLSLPPIQSKLIKPAICKINSYNDTINSKSNNIGKKVILKFKIDKDVSRQSSLPLLSSSPSSVSSSSLIASCDREPINKRFSSSENEIKEINQEIEPRLSFRDKLSNFENLSKEKDIGSSTNHLNQPSSINPVINQQQNLHHSHLQKVRKLTSSSLSINCDQESTINQSTGDAEIINELKVNQLNEPRLSFRDKLSNFENLAKGEDLIGSSSLTTTTTNHPPAVNLNYFNPPPPTPPIQQSHLSKDRKLTEAPTSSSSSSPSSTTTTTTTSSSSSSSSSTRISGHPILTSSLSSSSLSNHHPYHLHDEQIKKDHDQSSSTKLGEKSCSEAQLLMKKSNDNLKPNQDQRSMLSISGKKRCSNCGDELGRGCAAMVIETLSLYYHINCFRCSVCHIQLGNGTCGTDVRVRSNRLHCQNCYSNDEVGLTRV